MRKRLIKLIEHIVVPYFATEIADHLIENDAVIVVRCKDCKHRRRETIGMIDYYECTVFCGCYGRGYATSADDFCSYGERKEQK